MLGSIRLHSLVAVGVGGLQHAVMREGTGLDVVGETLGLHAKEHPVSVGLVTILLRLVLFEKVSTGIAIGINCALREVCLDGHLCMGSRGKYGYQCEN